MIRAWGWWKPPLFGAGVAALVAALVSPLEALGRQDLLTAHVAQHIVLADLAAPLLLAGLPPFAARWLRTRLAECAASTTRGARLSTWALSPIGAFILWAAATYIWFIPALHRAAVPGGAVHLIDHVSFFAFGVLIWLGAFDPRVEQTLRRGLRLGGLPWWARHSYAMATRIAMLPPALGVWVASGGVYHTGSTPRPFEISLPGDQERAASFWIGFEMMLFSLAFVLAFIFAAVSEGRRRKAAQR